MKNFLEQWSKSSEGTEVAYVMFIISLIVATKYSAGIPGIYILPFPDFSLPLMMALK